MNMSMHVLLHVHYHNFSVLLLPMGVNFIILPNLPSKLLSEVVYIGETGFIEFVIIWSHMFPGGPLMGKGTPRQDHSWY